MKRREFLAGAASVAAGAIVSACSSEAAPIADPKAKPVLVASMVTRWSDDPFALGAYSYLPVGATPADRRALQAPVQGRIFLAGEHTDVDAPAMTHGALASGRRAAEQVVSGRVEGSILVIGAGFAGLAAARLLADEGRSVVVLEGRDRIGGRVVTSTAIGPPLDLGAAWIHGIRNNPVAALANDLGVKWSVENGDTNAAFDPALRPLSDSEVASVEDAATILLKKALAASERADVDRSVADAVADGLAKLAPSQRVLVQAEIRRTVEAEFGADLGQLSSWEGDEGQDIAGDEVVLPDGYSPLVASLASGLDIRLGRRVSGVSYNSGGVTVTTDGGDERAAAVIVTVPLGVLQAGSIVFEPALPPSHAAALAKLGMGSLEKVILRFDRVFWPSDLDYIGFARADGRYIEWLNMAKHIASPVLVGFTSGTPARALRSLDDAAIVADAADMIMRAFWRG